MADQKKKTGIDDEALKEGRKPETVQSPSFESVLKTMRKATEHSARSAVTPDKVPFIVADLEIPDPNAALKNMEEAFRLLPECVKPKPDDVFFKSLPGNKVGESTKEGAKIDPMMLLHPAHRLAHVIAHETAHRKNTVPNEGLVEGYLRAVGVVDTGKDGEPKTTEKYNVALMGFSEFLERISGGQDPKSMAIEIYNLYYKGDYEKIYKMYMKHVRTLTHGRERDQAVRLFWDVFPELEYDMKGKTQTQSVFKFGKPTFAPKA